MIKVTLVISIVLYAIATGLLIRAWLGSNDKHNRLPTFTAMLAVILHAIGAFSTIFTSQGLDIGFFSALTFTAWLMAALLVLASLSLPIICLGLVVFPFALVTVILRLWSEQPLVLASNLAAGLEAHILFSILAYSLLSIAVAQSILLYIQDRYLHNKRPASFLKTLPPLETMETLLFRIIAMGVIALSISLLSGFIYLENMFAQHLVHKTVLSITAWFVFTGLLWGHYKFGWRGKTAIRWSISGFTLLMLAYFGSKFVIELLLNR